MSPEERFVGLQLEHRSTQRAELLASRRRRVGEVVPEEVGELRRRAKHYFSTSL